MFVHIDIGIKSAGHVTSPGRVNIQMNRPEGHQATVTTSVFLRRSIVCARPGVAVHSSTVFVADTQNHRIIMVRSLDRCVVQSVNVVFSSQKIDKNSTLHAHWSGNSFLEGANPWIWALGLLQGWHFGVSWFSWLSWAILKILYPRRSQLKAKALWFQAWKATWRCGLQSMISMNACTQLHTTACDIDLPKTGQMETQSCIWIYLNLCDFESSMCSTGQISWMHLISGRSCASTSLSFGASAP